MKKRRILFLDIDGVISSDKYLRNKAQSDGYMDSSRLLLLKRIVERTGAEIVLSTSWREHWDADPAKCDATWRTMFVEDLAKYGLRIADKTPALCSYDRAGEVRAWLQAHDGEIESFAILDDEQFQGWGELADRFVKTSGHRGGITEEEAERVIALFPEPVGF